MLLREYLDYKKILPIQFAKMLDIDITKLNQYLYSNTVPRPSMMKQICLLTEGKVDANDFNGTTREKIEALLLQRDKAI